MALNIYSQSGKLRATIEPTDSSRHDWVLMDRNVLKLTFTLSEFLKLEVNDYIDFDGQRFKLKSEYRPAKKSSIEYEYNVEFKGRESQTEDVLVLDLTDDKEEGTFALTDTARVHAQLVVDNLNRADGTKEWILGEVVASGNISINYDNTYALDALGKIADECDTEWWIEGTTINISRCEHGDLLELAYRHGLQSITPIDNETAPFFTRLYPLGSTRNIDRQAYGHNRLRLPGGLRFVEMNTHLGVVEYSEEAAFSHIYPRRTGTITSSRSEEATGEDGEPFTIWYFKEEGLPFNPNDYLMAGVVMKVHFVEGCELGGYDFELNYHEDTQEFEIITQFPNEVDQLPGGRLVPSPGDKYVLYDIVMPEVYVKEAEEELAAAVDEYLAKRSIDTRIYKAPSDYIWFEENGVDLRLGRRVRLASNEHFDEGYRDSRVTSISRCINRPSIMDIECTYAVASGRLTQLENNIVDIQTQFKQYLDDLQFQILKSWDSSDPTEYNVLSAVRTIRTIANSLKKQAEESDLKYLRKDIQDKAAELIKFLDGIEVVGEALVERLTVEDRAHFKESLSSENFASGFPTGTGWAIQWLERLNAAGVEERKAIMELDELTIRGALRVYEFIISQQMGENGTRLTTDMMRVHSIDPVDKIIYLDTEKGVLYNPFRAGDVIQVQMFGGLPTAGNNYNIIKGYEFQVTAVGVGNMADGEDRVDWLTYTSFVGDINQVAQRDVLTRVDSLTNPDRKGLIKHTSVEANAPYIDVIYGMKTEPDNAVRARLGKLSGIINYWWGQLKGFGFYSDNAYLRGDFQLRTGDDVRTMFEIVEGMLRSAMQSVTYNFTEDDNYLTNATFTKDMEGWEHESDIELYSFEGALIDMGINFLSGKNSVSEVVDYDGRQMLRLKDGYIRQENALIRKPEEDSVMFLNFRYKCITSGVLKIGFEDGTEGGDFELREVLISPNTEYKVFELEGTWDGVGDFFLSFTGDIYIEFLSFANKPLEDYKREVYTLFEQTDEYITAVATEVNNLENYVKTAGWITAADGHKLWATHETVDELGNRITTAESELKIQADQISATVKSIEKVQGDLGVLDSYVKTAGWITTADGNKLWATIQTVDALGNEVTTHKSSFHVTADKIESIVTSLEASEQWQSKMEQTADRLTLSINLNTGKMLYKDPTFKQGVNGTNLYNNSGGTGVVYERVAKTSDVPTDSTHMMRLTFIYGATTSPGLGGFHFATATRANAVFEAHIIAKIPAGYTLTFASNGYGDGGKHTWLSSQAGTGKWETYVCRVECGASGTFSSTNFFYIQGAKPTVQYSTNGTTWTSAYSETAVYVRIYNDITETWGSAINLTTNPSANKLFWYVGSATVYDLYVFEDVVSQINLTPGEVKIQAAKISLEGHVTANSNVQITTDGKIIARNAEISGKITATSGTIGGFNISGSYIGASGSGTASSSSANTFSISPSLICYGNSYMWVGMGSYVFPATGSGSWHCPMRVSVSTPAYGSSGDYNYGNIGAYISASGKLAYDDILASGNHALYIANGFISGFRLRTRRLKSTTTLTAQDNVIMGIGTSDFTIYLPASPQDGQIYFIRKVTSGNITIASASSHKIRTNWNGEASSVRLVNGNLGIFMWDRVNLYWTGNVCGYF